MLNHYHVVESPTTLITGGGAICHSGEEGGHHMVEWVSFSEAAKQLGISESTLRRRIKDKLIRAEKRDGPYGRQWFVDPSAIQTAQEIVDVVRVDRPHDLAALAHEVAEYLARQNAELITRIETLSTAVETLATKVDAVVENSNIAHQQLIAEVSLAKSEVAAIQEAVNDRMAAVASDVDAIRAKQDVADERAKKREEDMGAKLQTILQRQEERRWRWPWQRR